MRFFVLGVNHTTAPVALREQVAFVADQLAAAVQQGCRRCQINDLVIVSTCNRTELYACGHDPSVVTRWLAETRQLPLEHLTGHLYLHEERAAVHHLMRVCSGLDSMLLGEPQIFGQIKQALAVSREAGAVTTRLGRIFEQAFTAAKRVRSETAVGAQAVSLGYAVVQVARQMFADLRRTTALLVAAGEMNQLIGRHLADQGVGRILICNRSIERAELLAQALALRNPHLRTEVRPLAALADALLEADLVSSCTGSLHPVIHHDTVRLAMKKRRYHPQLLIDLAVPRDIEPSVADLDEVYLYSIDDLQQVIAHNLSQRQQAAVEAEALATQLADQWAQDEQARQVAPQIARYRQQAEHLREQELSRALQSLAQGVPPEHVLVRLSQALSAKLIHAPSQLIRQSALHNEPHVLAHVLAHLLPSTQVAPDPTTDTPDQRTGGADAPP